MRCGGEFTGWLNRCRSLLCNEHLDGLHSAVDGLFFSDRRLSPTSVFPPVIPKIVAEIVSVEASSTDGFLESISTAWGNYCRYPNRAIDMENIAVENCCCAHNSTNGGIGNFPCDFLSIRETSIKFTKSAHFRQLLYF